MLSNDLLYNSLKSLTKGIILQNTELKNFSSWKIGGPADFLTEPLNTEELINLRKFIYQNGIPFYLIGNGSNILFDDRGFRGIIIKIGNSISSYKKNSFTINVQAGISVPKLSLIAAKNNLSGLQHAIGIPGTLGGLITMNGGSIDHSISDIIESVNTIDQKGEIKTFLKKECGFEYRKSVFQNNKNMITDATLKFQHSPSDILKKEMKEILKQRKLKFPYDYPNCGSVFKKIHNEFPPGKLIEMCSLKGRRIGGAEVSVKHANFIINKQNAGSADILKLIEIIKKTVNQELHLNLMCEVIYLSPLGVREV